MYYVNSVYIVLYMFTMFIIYFFTQFYTVSLHLPFSSSALDSLAWVATGCLSKKGLWKPKSLGALVQSFKFAKHQRFAPSWYHSLKSHQRCCSNTILHCRHLGHLIHWHLEAELTLSPLGDGRRGLCPRRKAKGTRKTTKHWDAAFHGEERNSRSKSCETRPEKSWKNIYILHLIEIIEIHWQSGVKILCFQIFHWTLGER